MVFHVHLREPDEGACPRQAHTTRVSSPSLRRYSRRDQNDGKEHCESNKGGQTEPVNSALLAQHADELTQCGTGQVVPGGSSADDMGPHTQRAGEQAARNT